ncbi:MAG: diphthine--ammonia ligase [Nanoarchaeota archaeon]|nr:diphthine--ammonia ligase [Nanoarchaeota archaeon]
MQDYEFIKKLELGEKNDGSKILMLLEQSIKKIGVIKADLMFSGGVDSTLLAQLLKNNGCDITLIVAGTKNSPDVITAKNAAEQLRLKLVISEITQQSLEAELPKIKRIVGNNFVTLSIATTYYYALKKSENKIVFSGLGSEDLFSGYQKYEGKNRKCLQGLKQIFTRDLKRDSALVKHFKKTMRTPFLDKELVEYAINTDEKLKVKNNYKKWVLRKHAETIIPKEFAWRKRKAAQYGSGVVKMLKKQKPALGVLFTGGKDSTAALHKMVKQKFEITCLISLKSKNPDSYMFHTPNIDLVKYQSQALNIPLITGNTEGVKEKELLDLELVIKNAVKKHGIRGIITGALYSEYQASRIQKICEKLNLKCYNPLWHVNQYDYFKKLLKENYEIVFSSVAALGFDESWVGKKITLKDLEKLKKLEKKHGLNVAGEGGEFESLVLDAPLFKKKLIITDSKIISESEHNHKMIVKKVKLINKR